MVVVVLSRPQFYCELGKKSCYVLLAEDKVVHVLTKDTSVGSDSSDYVVICMKVVLDQEPIMRCLI